MSSTPSADEGCMILSELCSVVAIHFSCGLVSNMGGASMQTYFALISDDHDLASVGLLNSGSDWQVELSSGTIVIPDDVAL